MSWRNDALRAGKSSYWRRRLLCSNALAVRHCAWHRADTLRPIPTKDVWSLNTVVVHICCWRKPYGKNESHETITSFALYLSWLQCRWLATGASVHLLTRMSCIVTAGHRLVTFFYDETIWYWPTLATNQKLGHHDLHKPAELHCPWSVCCYKTSLLVVDTRELPAICLRVEPQTSLL